MTAPVTWTNGRLVLGDRVLPGGWLRIADGMITDLGSGPPPEDGTVRDLGGQWVTPGFVDIHVHGGGGATFSTEDLDEARRVVAFHRGHGTTTCLASLVTAPVDELERTTKAFADLVGADLIAGVHLEGPFLAATRCGAQDPRHLRPPDRDALARLLAAGTVRMITLAPELDGALDAVRQVDDAGVVAAVGHTDATYEQARAAFDAGARVATHLFNGMRGLHHRDPGPVGAALGDDRVTVEVINDGIHLHPAAVGLVARAAGADRVALITDAMGAAGMGDGDYRLGSMDVRVTDGVARLAGGTSIAGSTLTLDTAVRTAVREVGMPIEQAVAAATTVPARALGLDDRLGELRPGTHADLVLLDDDLHVTEVHRHGTPVP